MKKFNIPGFYRSGTIGRIKEARKIQDPRKRDFSPSILDFGPVKIHLARHFGFCYGVENAIERSYKALEENPDKRIFLLSQMIHNPHVNEDLLGRGMRFIMDTEGNQLVPWDEVTSDDLVIIPAFGTTLEIEALLQNKGIETVTYNTTCPFVEKVWKRSAQLGQDEFTVIIHGKPSHEETRATFSHSKAGSPSLVIRHMDDAQFLSEFILGHHTEEAFVARFQGNYSEGFDLKCDLNRIGVVNQTTMLATETQAIADFLKHTMEQKFGEENIRRHFADTRDTLCYATNDNQTATLALLEHPADLAFVVGGYNSSNTSHLVELCEEKVPTYFVSGPGDLRENGLVTHFNYPQKKLEESRIDWAKIHQPVRVILTSGASCPDTLLDAVLEQILANFQDVRAVDDVIAEFVHNSAQTA